MRAAMRGETEMYFAHVMREDRPVTEFIDSNYTFLNEDLAKYYGIPDVTGQGDAPGHAAARQPARRRAHPGQRAAGHVQSGSHLAGEARPVRAGEFPRHAAAAAARQRAGARSQRKRLPRTRSRRCATCSRCIAKIRCAVPATTAWTRSASPSRTSTARHVARFGAQAAHRRARQPDHRRNLQQRGRAEAYSRHRRTAQDFYRTLTAKLLTYATGRGTGVLRRGDHRPDRAAARRQ